MVIIYPDSYSSEILEQYWNAIQWYCPYCNEKIVNLEYRGIDYHICNNCKQLLIRRLKDGQEGLDAWLADGISFDAKILFPTDLFDIQEGFQILTNGETYEVVRPGIYTIPDKCVNIQVRSVKTGGTGNIDGISRLVQDHLYIVDWNKVDGGLVIPKIY